MHKIKLVIFFAVFLAQIIPMQTKQSIFIPAQAQTVIKPGGNIISNIKPSKPEPNQKAKIEFPAAGGQIIPQTAQTQPIIQPRPQTNPKPIYAKQILLEKQNYQNSNNPFSGQKLWINPNSDAENYIKNPNTSDANKALMQKIAAGAETQWFSKNWVSNIYDAANNYVTTVIKSGAMPTMVLYDIPHRDCGQYSAGGSDAENYKNEVNDFADAIGSRKAAVILEPDALTLTGCLDSQQLKERFDLIQYAVNKFKSNLQTAVYIDIGHPDWVSPENAATLLAEAGIQNANGFALNISNFYTNQQNIDYANQIDFYLNSEHKITEKHVIIDTGRNGNGSNGQWCNPSGRALGILPTTNTGNPIVDAYLWVKGPSGSDGNCNGGPGAGQFYPDYALQLAQGAHW